MTMHGSAKLAATVGVAAPLRTLMTAVLVGVGNAGLPTAAIAADDAVVESRPVPRYSPAGPGVQLVDHDLAAECADNARKRDARQAYNVSCFMLRDFMEAYHPGEEFTWQRAANRGFGYVGTRERDADTEQQVYVNWQSFSDGLQWGFTETEITRRLAGDPFAIVADAAARDRIRAALGVDVAAGPSDVFARRGRSVLTDERVDGIVFPAVELAGDRYGVLTEGRLRWFTPAGEPVEDARRQ